MPRPRIPRKISFNPNVTYFKPQGVPLWQLEVVFLSHDEAEALRLKYIKGLEQNEAAKEMHISRSTFQRVLILANKKVAQALIEGKAIKIGKTDG